MGVTDHIVTIEGTGGDEPGTEELLVICRVCALLRRFEAPNWPTPADLWRIEQQHLSAVAGSEAAAAVAGTLVERVDS